MMLNLKGKNLEMYKEARSFFQSFPHHVDILEGRFDGEDSCITLSAEQKAILLPLLANSVGGELKNLAKDEKIPASRGQDLFEFLNVHCTWQERVGFTHMISLLLNGSFSRFETSEAMTKFAETTRAYIQGSL